MNKKLSKKIYRLEGSVWMTYRNVKRKEHWTLLSKLNIRPWFFSEQIKCLSVNKGRKNVLVSTSLRLHYVYIRSCFSPAGQSFLLQSRWMSKFWNVLLFNCWRIIGWNRPIPRKTSWQLYQEPCMTDIWVILFIFFKETNWLRDAHISYLLIIRLYAQGGFSLFIF